jgi:hypothetical protein
MIFTLTAKAEWRKRFRSSHIPESQAVAASQRQASLEGFRHSDAFVNGAPRLTRFAARKKSARKNGRFGDDNDMNPAPLITALNAVAAARSMAV